MDTHALDAVVSRSSLTILQPQFSCACVRATLLQSCLTLCNPMDCSPADSSVHRILQIRMPEWVAISSSRGSSQFRGWIYIFVFCISSWVLYHWSQLGSPHSSSKSTYFTTNRLCNVSLFQRAIIMMFFSCTFFHPSVRYRAPLIFFFPCPDSISLLNIDSKKLETPANSIIEKTSYHCPLSYLSVAFQKDLSLSKEPNNFSLIFDDHVVSTWSHYKATVVWKGTLDK